MINTILLLLLLGGCFCSLFGGGDNLCTPSHCYACDTRGDSKWCLACGNGMALEGQSTRQTCSGKLTIPNCRVVDPQYPDNLGSCGECQTNFYLASSKKECIRITLPKDCNYAVRNSKTGVIECLGCKGKFLLNDLSGCALDSQTEGLHLPDGCLYGDTLAKKGACRLCKVGMMPSSNGMHCLEEVKTGCKFYHPNEPQMCLACDEQRGYYAVDATYDEGNVYQICEFSAWILNSSLALILIYRAIW